MQIRSLTELTGSGHILRLKNLYASQKQLTFIIENIIKCTFNLILRSVLLNYKWLFLKNFCFKYCFYFLLLKWKKKNNVARKYFLWLVLLLSYLAGKQFEIVFVDSFFEGPSHILYLTIYSADLFGFFLNLPWTFTQKTVVALDQ